ncbi:hypothetical protein [Salinibacterium sp. ZJ70]|uniref:hypothetical protein n=1 Tax=Salinibacterium sp. ZJ70 TaxID=2708084 RepID=UPI001421EC8B|nr:hypothetical protein [Salinibacterium sp. ZJ70]
MLELAWTVTELGMNDLAEDDAEEQMGTKSKYWVRLPDDDRLWLMKLSRVANDGFTSGEDWAEWLVQHLAALLGVPAATIRPSRFEGSRACVSRSMLSGPDERLEHGNSLLAGAVPDYTQVKGHNVNYTVGNVKAALDGVRPPTENVELSDFTAYDAWCGYVVMDAWLAAQDRHDENWAVIQRDDLRCLAPSFDHGNALGFQLRDDARLRHLQEDTLATWASRGASRQFADRPTLVGLALSALRLASLQAQQFWIERLDAVITSDVESVVSAVPTDTMSEVGHTFVVRLLEENRRRLLDGYKSR